MKLKEIGLIITGNTPSKANKEFYNSRDIKFFKPSDLRENIVNELNESEEYISQQAKESARMLPKGSVLVTCIGTIGKVGILSDEGTCNQQINAIVPNELVDSEYLAYLLLSKKDYLKKKANAPVVPIINKTDFSNLEIEIHDRETQKNIVNRLKKIRELIDIKYCELEKLDELIKSQFVEMFKDEEKYPKEYLKDNVIEMFIGPFGSALKNECFVDESESSCVVYEQKHAINKFIGDFRYVNSNKHNELKRFEVLPNDIIVSCRGTIGETFVIPENAPLGIMHPSIMKIRLDFKKYNPVFFNEVIKQYLSDNINKTQGGTVKMGIKATDLGNTKFIRPDLDDQIKFLNIKNQIEKQKYEISSQLDKLDSLQKSLMQEYFS